MNGFLLAVAITNLSKLSKVHQIHMWIVFAVIIRLDLQSNQSDIGA
jgi:hypothetical protein